MTDEETEYVALSTAMQGISLYFLNLITELKFTEGIASNILKVKTKCDLSSL